MHFLEFYSDNILYKFRIGKTIHLQEAVLLYMQFMVCIMHSCGLAGTKIEMELHLNSAGLEQDSVFDSCERNFCQLSDVLLLGISYLS